MRWKLTSVRQKTTIRRLYEKPVYWPVADQNGLTALFPGDSSMAYKYATGSDTSRVFKYRLFILHSADTTIYAPAQRSGFRETWRRLHCPAAFSLADLRQMEAAYRRRMLPRWPTFRTIHRTRRRDRQQSYCAFTLPLFSADYNRVVVWQYSGWVTGESRSLLLYRRKPGGGWDECVLWSWGIDE
ncbi:hypothetical protein E5K00_20640 [Hymenobacter aquaticus]|uniref:Uncharacterized protein n=1 Tax=Hymenobacter aquaticus TaxID=1867101 RepID=A0A4Z0PRQ0_9BACT|nr:hypothetical protein [Hymenobacter aquaticus]TGE20407.1 hypothetical protein E5K00_20640 [Hymenobacter aquaticus]